MKIAYVAADSGIPIFGEKGGSIHIRELVNALNELGHEITVLAAKIGNATGANHLNAEVSKVRLSTGDDSISDPGDADDHRRAKEKRYARVGDAIYRELVERYQQSPFDAIYERYSLWSAAGVRAAHKLKIPCIVEVNSPLVLEQQRYRKLVSEDLAKSIEQEVFSSADVIFAVSDQVQRYVTSRINRPNDVNVLFNGVDTKRFNPWIEAAQVVSIVSGEFVVGFVGSLKPWHGIEVLLDAFRFFQQRIPNAHLLMVGDGPMRGWVEGYVHASGLESRVTVTGWTNHDALPGLIQRMDVTVAPYPALDEFYFSPLKVFEYLAMGKTVVASDIGQLNEIMEHGKNGILVESGEAVQLAEQLEFLYLDPIIRKRFGRAAARRAKAFAWIENAKIVVDFLESLQISRTNQNSRKHYGNI